MITGLLIAAGLSHRMGGFKPLMDLHGKTLIAHILDKLMKVCENVVVVTGHNSDTLEKYLERKYNFNSDILSLIKNEEYQNGMFSSIKRGAEIISDSSWILYHLVDQPDLPLEFYHDFIKQIEDGTEWIQPTYKSKKGHPILFGNNILRIIKDSHDQLNLREISNNNEIKKKFWECHYPSVLTDVDTPEDLSKLVENKK